MFWVSNKITSEVVLDSFGKTLSQRSPSILFEIILNFNIIRAMWHAVIRLRKTGFSLNFMYMH